MKKYFLPIVLGLLLVGCSQVEDLQNDPNRPTAVTPDLILTHIEASAFNNVSLNAALASRYITYTDGVDQYQYYNWQRADYGDYDDLKQVQKMIGEAKRNELPAYEILGSFFNAYYAVELTQVFGDVPYQDALRATDGVYMPVYDKQEDIYKAVLDTLNKASLAMAADTDAFRGDIIYDGDPLKWQKLINSYTLRVLMSLSAKMDNADLNVVNRFREIVNNPGQYPIFESNADNGALHFVDTQNNRYPFFNSNDLQTAYYMEKSFVQRLQNLKDPRLFAMAEKKPSAAGSSETDFTAYGGLLGSAPLSDNGAEAVAGEASRLDPRYFLDPVNEPSLLMGNAELQFILAEAATRKWIDADAETYYKNGIASSMQFYGITDFGDYLDNPDIQLQTGNEIQQIMTQKHIALFLNTGWQMFYEHRRAGFPEFNVEGGGILNNGRIPKRFLYPTSETVNNPENLNAAIQRQYPEGDNINEVMWLLK